MHERLSAVTHALRRAVERRSATADPEAASLLAALEGDHGAEPSADPPPDRLAALAEGFGLDPLEVDLLAVAAAGEVDANVSRAYGLLIGTGVPTWPTVGLALELAGATTDDPVARAVLNPLAPLRRHGLLLELGDGPLLTRRLRVAARVARHLVADDTPTESLVSCLHELVAVDVDPAPAVRRALDLGVRLTWIRAAAGSAGDAVAAAAVEGSGREALAVDLTRAGAQADVAAVVTDAVLEAGLTGRVLVLVGAQRLAPPDAPPLVELLATSVVPVVCVADRGWDSGWSPRVPLVLDAPRLDQAARADLWATAALAVGLVIDRDDHQWHDVLAMRLSPTQIVRAARDADLAATVDGRVGDVGDLRLAVRRLASAGDATPPRTSASFDDLVLPPAALGELRRLVSWARHRDAVLAQGPLNGAGGKGTGIAALFGGGPGTGKTLAAHVVSDALGLDLLRVDLSSVVDKYVGETEKNLERVFDEAESMNVVLFFDEADSLFGSRSAVSDSRDRYANLEVSYLLQRMEDFDGITILATNLRGNLDPAFSRRLQFMITFPDPDEPTRLRLWHQHLSHVALLDDADPPDLGLLARHAELAGGDIRNVVLAAAYDAAEDNDGRVAMRHLAVAAVREFTKLRKRAPAALAGWLGEPGDTPAAPAVRG